MNARAATSTGQQQSSVCRHLGYDNDPLRHADVPSANHRCFLWMQRERIDLAHQDGFCLSEMHSVCPWLLISTPETLTTPPPADGLIRGLGGIARHTRRGMAAVARACWSGARLAGHGVARAAKASPSILRRVGHGFRLVGVGIWRAACAFWYGVGVAADATWAVIAFTGRAILWPFAALWRAARKYGQRPSRATATPSPVAASVSTQSIVATADPIETLAELIIDTASVPAAKDAIPIETTFPGIDVGPSPAPQVSSAVERGIAALRQGDKELAYGIFARATEDDPTSKHAWMWRGATAPTPAERRRCFRHVLEIDPTSTIAIVALENTPRVAPETSARQDSERDETAVRAALQIAEAREARPKIATWQCDRCYEINPWKALVCICCGNASPVVSEQLIGDGNPVLQAGLLALKGGNEQHAHTCFVEATEIEPANELGWYWRAKTAETADETVLALRQIVTINPLNRKARDDLASAEDRRRLAGQAEIAILPPNPIAAKPSLGIRLWRASLAVSLDLAAVLAFVVCLLWQAPRIAEAVDSLAGSDVAAYMPAFSFPGEQIETGWGWVPTIDVPLLLPFAVSALFLVVALVLPKRSRLSPILAALAGALGIWCAAAFMAPSSLGAIIITLCGLMLLLGLLVGVDTLKRWNVRT